MFASPKCILLLVLAMAVWMPQGGDAAEPLTVHIVPHTHDDVGWLKNVDQYYSGSNNTIQHAGVRYIITTVVKALASNPERKFTYVEQAFFQRWWRVQDNETRALTKKLVAAGQLNFANGGWCMHDEAATHYVDMVDQTTLGHRLLKEEFDYVPTVGWQLDPFGHSATQAALLSAEVGFDGLFFGRIDYQDLALRQNESRCEFIWRASPSLGPDAQVFAGLTGSYHGNYGPPSGFDWNVFANDEPMVDNKDLETYNVPSRVDDFVKVAMWQFNRTRGNHIMMTMGSDFQYEAAEDWYINLDKLIEAVNADGRIRAMYSSPALYTQTKLQEAKNGSVTWPVDSGNNSDFFPYADGPHQFWTGYFTSRPALKRYVRTNSAFINAVRQIQAMGGDAVSGLEQLEKFTEAMGVNQHHDAVSGTAKQHVAFDYAKRMAEGQTIAEALASRVLKTTGGFCRRLNETVCPQTQVAGPASVPIAIWNQMGQARTELIAVPVSSSNVTVMNMGKPVPVQVQQARETVNNYARHTKEATHTALFKAELPPVGHNTYELVVGNTVVPGHTPPHTVRAKEGPPPGQADVVLENELVSLTFSGTTGRLMAWSNKASGVSTKVDQTFCYYRSSVGDKISSQASGAYIFRPDSANPKCLPVGTGTATIDNVVHGPLASELTQTFGDYVTQTVRLAAGERHAEFLYTVGHIPLEDPLANHTAEKCVAWRNTEDCSPNGPRDPSKDLPCDAAVGTKVSGYCECIDGRHAFPVACGHVPFTCDQMCKYQVGKEVVMRFSSDIANNGVTLTDSNGREMLYRQRNFRPTWPLKQTEPVAGNYFPITTAAAIHDATRQLTVVVDAAHGGGSVTDGELEVMVHRRVLHDDSRGVGEPLNETQYTGSYAGQFGGRHFGPALIIRGRHFVSLEPPKTAAKVWRSLQERMYARPVLAFGASNATEGMVSLVNAALPANVQLMSFTSLDTTTVLVRLAHLFGIGEDSTLSQPATVDLSTLLNPAVCGFKITSIVERTLTNNQDKAALLARRASQSWTPKEDTLPHAWRQVHPVDSRVSTDVSVTLGPLEIKTFELTIAR